MAEIKHTFQAGKMNKDLDERIVPQGQYRDALNIEVLTSDGENVGAVQNLYGNVERLAVDSNSYNLTTNFSGEKSYCVGHVTNERNNDSYFFIAAPTIDSVNPEALDSSGHVYKDLIVRYNSDDKKLHPVFTDIFRVTLLADSIISGFLPNNEEYDSIYVDQNFINHARVGMRIQVFNNFDQEILNSHLTYNNEPTNINQYPITVNNQGDGVYIRQIDKRNNIIYFDRQATGYLAPESSPYPDGTFKEDIYYVVLSVDNTLKFNRNLNLQSKLYITGVNIINNLLIWTDNYSEPKKINLDRLSGYVDFNEHSDLLLTDPGNSSTETLIPLSTIDSSTESGYIEDHITLIKRAPRTAPKLIMSRFDGGYSNEDVSYTGNANMNWLQSGDQSQLIEVGESINIVDSNGNPSLSGTFKQGQELIFTALDGSLEVIAQVLMINPSNNRHRVKILKISDDITEFDLSWNVTIKQSKPKFESKFGRFGYRYKYEDGEYSPFSPWSEIAFLPSRFDYIPKKGHNLGMINTLRDLKVANFITSDYQRPDDVVAVDILFKDTTSPNVYIVKSIRRGFDDEWNDDSYSNKGEDASGVVEITTEMIHKALPSSQSLRAWDNVPLKALAQEVTGNRLVFANYEQNYNILNKVIVNPSVETLDHRGNLKPEKSIKSMRDYKIGVVFGDKYGRETPVMGVGGRVVSSRFNEIGTTVRGGTILPDSVSVEKSNSYKVNKLQAQLIWDTEDLGGEDSSWMEYYKYYVKETSNEYYNLVMDRWYPAEDGNVWLSFQSADRNKVDEETYLILKNRHGSEEPVEEQARYKVLAIENNAPSFIKTTNRIIGRMELDDDTVPDMTNTGSVDLESSIYENVFAGYRPEGVLFARIVGELGGVVRFSDFVRVARMNDAEGSIKIVGRFGETANMSGEAMFGTSTGLSLSIEVKDAVEESRPEFEGRFFVKVYKDIVLSNQVLGSNVAQLNYVSKSTFAIGYISDEGQLAENSAYQGDFSQAGETFANSDGTASAGVNYYNAAWNASGSVPITNPDGFGNHTFTSQLRDFWKWYWAYGAGETHPSVATASPAGKKKGKWFIDNCTHTIGDQCNGPGGHLHYGIWHDAGTWGGIQKLNTIHFSAVGETEDIEEDPEALDFFDKLSQEGTLFRFRSDPGDNADGNGVIYQVQGYSGVDESGDWTKRKNFHKSNNSCEDCEFNSGASDQSITGGVCTRQTFLLHFSRLDDATQGLNPNDWDPRSALAHDGSTTMFLEIVEVDYDEASNTQTSRGNAIWETEPKEDLDLDLYYEATDAIPLKLNNTNIASFAPTESSVIIENRTRSTTSPILLNKCWEIAEENGNLIIEQRDGIVKYAVRDVVGLGERDDGPNEVFAYPIAIGDTISFTRENGMVTEAKVIDHWHPIKNFNNIPEYQEEVPSGAVGEYDLVTVPEEISTYKSSETITIYCSVGTQNILGINKFSTSNPGDLINQDGELMYEVFSDTLTIHPGTFTTGQLSTIDGVTVFDVFRCNHVDGEEGQQNFPVGQHFIKLKKVTGFYRLDYKTYKSKTTLPWFNCYSFGNGLESDRIRDDFNASQIDNGCKVSTGLESYKKERRGSGLIYSGIYNSTSGVNELNEFNMANPITKDLNPSYGSIQALKSRDTNLVTFCEDKVLQILANKDALFNADGSSNVTASNAVLGDAKAFAGDYGISKDPSSLATDAYRMYFTDKQRRKVLRLSQDGLTPISDAGMKSYFRNSLINSTSLLGSFDTVKGEYNLTIKKEKPGSRSSATTVSYNERTKGWPSFKSFIPESGLSINSEYLTCYEGKIWSHHNINAAANAFYGQDAVPSTIEVLFNDNPSVIKSFASVNYEGTQAKINKWDTLGLEAFDLYGDSIGSISDGEYYNLDSKDGWYVESFDTDLQKAKADNFKDKEGKWFSYITGHQTTINNVDYSDFSVQGIGKPLTYEVNKVEGCTNPGAVNYNSLANLDDGSCYFVENGCTDPTAFNYNPQATTDDGSCVETIFGCTDPIASNYNFSANLDDGSCTYDVPLILGCLDDGTGELVEAIIPGVSAINYGCSGPSAAPCNPQSTGVNVHHLETCIYPSVQGCTNPDSENYNPLATYDDGSCIEPPVLGCTDVASFNYNPLANQDDGSCVPYIGGCMSESADNYNPEANFDDGECTYTILDCTDPVAENYNPDANTDDGSCIYIYGCIDDTAFNYNPLATNPQSQTSQFDFTDPCIPVILGCTDPDADNYNPDANTDDGHCFTTVLGCTDPDANNYNPNANTDDGSCRYPPDLPFNVIIDGN